MIGYVLIALGSLFIAFCCGMGAGNGVGYKQGRNDMMDLFKRTQMHFKAFDILIDEVDAHATLQTPEGSDRETP